jgi:hypothetical protein
MAYVAKCGGCGQSTSYLFAAQYVHNTDTQIICLECYGSGYRCYFVNNSHLCVSNKQPDNSVLAKLYWDEGGCVTGSDCVCYPIQNQNEAMKE